ncbi:competence type IV pilus major pilin ComGC [Neobacillus sp. PS3-40]|uniref:competence type IV pilus major pilin ComGC n=1 Tax=Neobacillus sp. PS3-40 TaxID=3070679 RepID=UPI0027DF5B63|nr:competence type IV pilus major pilin ComGC [Neobacillus sp. PS3-40]WML45291.1 competence type IV pilus major pilin ComGC [Neobacillus sp. PS3-40]
MKNENGFTLIEMMIVMLIISVLLIITIPNVTKHSANINNKGCQAFVDMVQAQVQSYQIENNKFPTVSDLKEAKYINNDKCPDGTKVVTIDSNGIVSTDPPMQSTP